MAPKDDDILDGRVPPPDAEPTARERAHAKTFADLIDKTLAGRTAPVMSADDRTLLEVATVIRAASGNAELSRAKQRSLVENALSQAVAPNKSNVVPIARRRVVAPWLVAGGSMLVAAAAILLWLKAPKHVVDHAPTAQQMPENWKSRASDSLIGPIAREHAGDASARLDTIFADRLDGYRELRLRGGRR
jgi:hypothetical protein